MTYGKRTLIVVDQLLNTLLGGWPDETLSSRCYRWARDGVRAWPCKLVDGLFFWQKEHCKSSYESEREGRQSPPELRHAKERRALSVSSAVVEIDGLEFDASLDSIYRMNAVLFAAQLDAKPDSAVVRWVMSDNVVREVSLRQLRAAYVQAVERLVYDWPEVYTELNK
jgi:hypothetical protein